MFEFDMPAADRTGLVAWFDGFTAEIGGLDYDAARRRFDSRVATFSTHLDVVSGLDQFVDGQWRRVWPTMADFRWHTESMRSMCSPDRLMAFCALTWGSTGFHLDGRPFDRPGRASFVLIREALDRPWRGIHAHVSLMRGVPQQSHGRRPPATA